MPRYRIVLKLEVDAADVPEAHDRGQEMLDMIAEGSAECDHPFNTYNETEAVHRTED